VITDTQAVPRDLAEVGVVDDGPVPRLRPGRVGEDHRRLVRGVVHAEDPDGREAALSLPRRVADVLDDVDGLVGHDLDVIRDRHPEVSGDGCAVEDPNGAVDPEPQLRARVVRQGHLHSEGDLGVALTDDLPRAPIERLGHLPMLEVHRIARREVE